MRFLKMVNQKKVYKLIQNIKSMNFDLLRDTLKRKIKLLEEIDIDSKSRELIYNKLFRVFESNSDDEVLINLYEFEKALVILSDKYPILKSLSLSKEEIRELIKDA